MDNFCFYAVTLWVNSASGFCPSAPLGVLLSIVTKVTKKTLLRLRRKRNQNDGFAGEKPHFASIAPTVKLCKSPPCLRTPLPSANSNGEWELIYIVKAYSNYFSSRGFVQKDNI